MRDVAIDFAHHRFCRVHLSIDGRSPAIAVHIADHQRTIEELVAPLDMAKTRTARVHNSQLPTIGKCEMQQLVPMSLVTNVIPWTP